MSIVMEKTVEFYKLIIIDKFIGWNNETDVKESPLQFFCVDLLQKAMPARRNDITTRGYVWNCC